MHSNSISQTIVRALTLIVACSACLDTVQAAPPHPGYTFFAGSRVFTDTFLIDMDGNLVHTWPSEYKASMASYLLDDGAILHPANDPNIVSFVSKGKGGRGGRIERIAWDGTLEWSYKIGNTDFIQHHDIEPMPNGNVLAIVWERHTRGEAIAAGRDPCLIGDLLWSDTILEIEPVGATGGNVVWSWVAWDHLVQNYDANMANYGDPCAYPGRIDINFPVGSKAEDWLHMNAVAYNADLDQIVVSPRRYSEVWVISHAPGASGELMYRWGNPQAYGRGTAADEILDGPHNAQWIPEGTPGAGNMTVFNNARNRGYSSVDEWELPWDANTGTYYLAPGAAYGPNALTWTCDNIDGEQFSQRSMGGFQRLPNGNNLICLPPNGQFIETDETCSTVWSYSHTVAPESIFKATRIDPHDPRLAGRLDCPRDLTAFSAEWLRTNCEANDHCNGVDCNWDGKVDLLDFVNLK